MALILVVCLGIEVVSRSAPSRPDIAPAPPPSSTPTISPTSPAMSRETGPLPSPNEKELLILPSSPRSIAAFAPPHVKAASAILMDAVSGQILYAQNADAERPMASTTKIMTALLFCERVRENEVIVAGPSACKVKDSSLHLRVGERISAHDLLRAILMRSANDGCVAAAEYVAGSEAAFVNRMNARARELGAFHTHFMNPHGLTAPGHYTTARDLALIARAAMQNPRISEVVGTRVCRIDRSINKHDVVMRNHSHFLGHFPGADGVKTGWTIPAGHCYVGSATWGAWRLISVVLKSPNYVQETSALMKYGFYNFEPHMIAAAGTPQGICLVRDGARPTVTIRTSYPLQFVSRKGEVPWIERRLHINTIKAPLLMGSPVGILESYVNGKRVGEAPVIAAETDPLKRAPEQVASGWLRWIFLAPGIFALSLVSLRYVARNYARIATFTKSARRRRRRIATRV